MNGAEGRLYNWIAASLGVALLAASALLMVGMLATVIGPFSVASTPPVGAAERIGLWYPSGAGVLSMPYRAQTRQWWQQRFPAPSELIDSTSLAELAAREPSFVIVGHGERMNAAEVKGLREYVRKGGAVLLTGWLAVGADPQAELDTSLMRDLLAVSAVQRLPRDQSYFVAAGERGPLLAGVDPGQRVAVPAEDSVPALPGTSSELFWSNWAVRPQEPASGASVRMRLGKGRLAWTAIGPALSGNASDEVSNRIFRNAADWIRRRPASELVAWPHGARFAGLLAMDTEHGFPSAVPVAKLAHAQGMKVTFMVLSQLAPENSAALAELAALGEIGSHADVHDGFEGQAPAVQRQRLDTSLRALRELNITNVHGFRPPLESYDAETLSAVAESGFDYMLGDLELTSQVPELLAPSSGRSLVQIPRTGIDDIELLVKRQLTDPDEFDRILFADVGRLARGGGLYYLSFHTQYFGDPRRLALLERIMRELRRRKAWVAPAGEIAQWWRKRSQIAVRIQSAGPRRVQVDVTNTGTSEVSDAAVRVYANMRLASAKPASTTVFGRAPRVVVESGQEHADVFLPPLPPGASGAYFLDFKFSEPEPD